MTQTVGFIGLGAMGDGMSKNLLRAGFNVRGYDVEPARVERLILISAGGLDPAPPAALREHFREERLAQRTRAELEATLNVLAKIHTPAVRAA